MKEIRTRGLVRQLGKHGDFISVLEVIDRLELAGLVEDVYRHREFDSLKRRVDQVKVPRLSDRGVAYFNMKCQRPDNTDASDCDGIGGGAKIQK